VNRLLLVTWPALVVVSAAAACNCQPRQSLYRVGGTVVGLTDTVVLQNNGGDDLSVDASGPFTFATALASGASYGVTIKTQPAGQTCSVGSGTGTMAQANVTSVSVTCVVVEPPPEPRYTVGGTVSGLLGTVVLQDNGGDDLNVDASGPFTFATSLVRGASYVVTVKTQPAGQLCSVGSGTGTVAAADVTSVSVTCVVVEPPLEPRYTVGGTVSGLVGTVVLQNNGGDDLSVGVTGPFTFATSLVSGAPYSVTVLHSPSGQRCSVDAGTGAGEIASADVTTAHVTCVELPTYAIGGTVSGLTGTGLVLQNLGTDDLSISTDGPFVFGTRSLDGAPYAVTVRTPPGGQDCQVVAGAGSVSGANVISVQVTCSDLLSSKTWTARSSKGDFYAIAGDGANALVAVGGIPAVVATSTDNGVSWVHRPTSALSYLSGVAYGNGTWVAVGYTSSAASSVVQTSTDGLTWTAQTGPSSTRLTSVVFGKGVFVAVGFAVAGAGAIFTSTDGVSWTSRTSPTTSDLVGVGFVNDTFIAFGSYGKVVTSSDGATWAAGTGVYADTFEHYSVVYHAGTYIAVGQSGDLMKSFDGSTWSYVPRLAPYAELHGVAYGASTFVAVGRINSGYLYTSTDAATWSTATEFASCQFNGLAFVNGQFVAVGFHGGLFTSPDGTAWTQRSWGWGTFQSVAYGNGRYAAVAAGYAASSTDGAAWEVTSTPVGSGYGVAFGGGTFVAVGSKVLTSVDGAAWTVQPYTPPQQLNGVVYDGTQFVAVGLNGTVLTSPDGVTWSPATSGTTKMLSAVAYSDGTYVAVGASGTVLKATTPSSWTVVDTSSLGIGSTDLRGVAFGAGRFVAVSGSTTIITSSDGAQWAKTTGGTSSLAGIAYGGGTFIAVGSSYVDGVYSAGVYTSPNGTVWTQTDTGATSSGNANALYGVTIAGGRAVAVGLGGAIVVTN
jgi:hypothetical protein